MARVHARIVKRGEGQGLERQFAIGIAGFALVIGALAIAGEVDSGSGGKQASKPTATANLRLAKLSTADRRDVDYARLDARLRRLAEKPAVVGLAVGIVENGRINFLNGYGETLEGSGEPVTPQTVFRWASVSKGVAGTMAAKLAEQGKLDLNVPIARYQTTLRLPGGAEQRATLGDVLSHRLGIYRNAWDDKLEAGESAERGAGATGGGGHAANRGGPDGAETRAPQPRRREGRGGRAGAASGAGPRAADGRGGPPRNPATHKASAKRPA